MPMTIFPRGVRRVLGGPFLLTVCLAFAASAANDPNPAKAEAELKAVRSQIDKVQAEMERDAGRRDKLTKELEETEKTVSGARGELDRLRRERAIHTARRAELAALRRTEESALGESRAALAGQIRAAHMIGQEEPLKLLLNQRDPAQTGRVLTYYQYFGRARASQIAAINSHIAELATLDAQVAEEEARLAALEDQRKGELSRLQTARERRGRALVSLEAESKNRARELEKLKDQQGGLEKLVRELRRALERIDKFPTDSKDAFAKLRGRLSLPVSGKLLPSFGPTSNRAPVVEAGPRQVVHLADNDAVLDGQAVDDGFGGSVLTATWTKLDGPAVAARAVLCRHDLRPPFMPPGPPCWGSRTASPWFSSLESVR
jgi:septal ring factor EnvC (AmiA/AmiB activator)